MFFNTGPRPSINLNTGKGIVTVRIEGMDQIEANLKTLRETFSVKTGGVVNRGLMAGAMLIRDEARSLAPVLGGSGASERQKIQIAKLVKSFKSRAQHQAGRALSIQANQRIRGNLKNNIIAHYVRSLPNTVWVRVRTKTWIFAERRNIAPKRWGSRGGADPSNMVDNPNYWWLVEFGAQGRPGIAFMRRAFEHKKGDAAIAAAEHMRKEIAALSALFTAHSFATLGIPIR